MALHYMRIDHMA